MGVGALDVAGARVVGDVRREAQHWLGVEEQLNLPFASQRGPT